MNKALLIGNLTRDPELSTIPNGTAVCKFSIAVNRVHAKSDGSKETDFFNIIAWRQLGENCGKFLKKGSKVGIVGQIQIRQYEQDGVKKFFTEIIADEVEFLSPKTGGGTEDHGTPEMTPVSDDSLPF
jgi:single-strand DNA-binding protein